MKLPEIEITIRYKGTKRSDLKRIRTSTDIYEILKSMHDPGIIHWQEEMILICLNPANKVLGYYRVSRGGTTGTVCDAKIIFTVALNCAGTTQIILSHNHPSGNLKPSHADEQLTRKISEAGKVLDIKLLDSIIYTEEGYYSFADEGNQI